jgi:hypothetical protein
VTHNTAPATKADIQMLMDAIGNLYDATARWNDETKKEVTEHFDLVAENLRYELVSAHREKVELLDEKTRDHDRRLRTLEHRIGA